MNGINLPHQPAQPPTTNHQPSLRDDDEIGLHIQGYAHRFAALEVDEGPACFGAGQDGAIRFPDDLIAAQRADSLHVGDPRPNDDSVAGQGGLEVVDLVRPGDPGVRGVPVPFGRPALRRGMGDGGCLHPVHIGRIVRVVEFIDFAGKQVVVVVENGRHDVCRESQIRVLARDGLSL